MNGIGLLFVSAGLLFILYPSAAARYPDSTRSGKQFVRFASAPLLITLGLLLTLEITIQ